MDYNFLSKTQLFSSISVDDLKAILSCLEYRVQKYNNGEFVYHIGDMVKSVGLILSGSVNVESDDLWGNKTLLAHLDKGEIFGETYACLNDKPMLVNVVSSEKSEIMFLNVSKIINICPNGCRHHNLLIQNLLKITAEKSLNLSRRIFYTSSKSIRGRLLAFLSEQAIQKGSCQFSIPFNRQQLADYLSVDRSAMSNELSKMKNDGIIDYYKNSFILNKKY